MDENVISFDAAYEATCRFAARIRSAKMCCAMGVHAEKVEVEIGVPDGFVATGEFRVVADGDWYLDATGVARKVMDVGYPIAWRLPPLNPAEVPQARPGFQVFILRPSAAKSGRHPD